MSDHDYARITRDGLWSNNPAAVQMLGLCPLLAVTGTVVNGLGLGLATLAVLTASNTLVSLIRNTITQTVRLPVFVMIIAALVTLTEMIMQAYTFRLYQILGIFIPLIVTNCTILGRAESFAARNRVLPAAVDGLMMGTGFLVVLVLLGGMRELVGQGTLFADMHLLFGPMAADWQINVIDNYHGFLFAVLPPGAFIGLGLIIAGKNLIDGRIEAARQHHRTPLEPGAKRVRTTGQVS
jgi:electron transport complex protein RnfE